MYNHDIMEALKLGKEIIHVSRHGCGVPGEHVTITLLLPKACDHHTALT